MVTNSMNENYLDKLENTTKIVIDLELYDALRDEIKDKQQDLMEITLKYDNVIKYLLSECEVKKYNDGEKYLKYDYYHNHIGEWLKLNEPELYKERLEQGENEDE